MGWLSELLHRNAKRQSRRRLPKRELAPVEDIVEQELLVSDVAVRMGVKNEIIMNALARGKNWDRSQVLHLVRSTIERLAEERERDAAHISRVRDEIRRRGRSSWTEGSYDGDDNPTLKHRQAVYEGVSEELRARLQDDEYIGNAASRAHELAWEEIGTSLKDRAEHPYYSGGHTEEYQRERDDRIQQLIAKDLTQLVQQQQREKPKKRIFRRERGSGNEVVSPPKG